MLFLKNKIGVALLSFVFFTNVVSAANHAPQFIIDKGGFEFHAFYKLYIPSVGDNPHSKLVVEAIASRPTYIAASYNGLIGAGELLLNLNFRRNGKRGFILTHELKNEKQAIEKVSNISPSSEWYPCLLTLLTQFGSRFDSAQDKHEKYSIVGALTTTANAQIQPLSGSILHTTYNIRNRHYSPDSYLSGRVVVDVVTKREKLKHGNRSILVTKAVFCTKKYARRGDKESVVKFVKNRNGLREISKKHFHRSSVWYPYIKKIAAESMKRYLKCRRAYKKVHT